MKSDKKNIQGFTKQLAYFKYRYDYSTIYADWLRQFRLLITLNGQEERNALLAKYDQADQQRLKELTVYAMEVIQTEIANNGWYDFFGLVYEELVSSYKASGLGQFFTPPDVCDLVCRLTVPPSTDELMKPSNIHDPTCGSGRNLLAFHHAHIVPLIEQQKVTNSMFEYSGNDLDPMCVDMTVMNMAIHGMCGFVIYGDALWPDKTYGVWSVNPSLLATQGAPHVVTVPKEDWMKYRITFREHQPASAAAPQPTPHTPPPQRPVQKVGQLTIW